LARDSPSAESFRGSDIMSSSTLRAPLSRVPMRNRICTRLIISTLYRPSRPIQFHTSSAAFATEVPNQPPQTKLAETRLRRFWRLVSVQKGESTLPPVPHPLTSRWLHNIPRLETSSLTPGKHHYSPPTIIHSGVLDRRGMECCHHGVCTTTYPPINKSGMSGCGSTYPAYAKRDPWSCN
jgi:hypothetical protein